MSSDSHVLKAGSLENQVAKLTYDHFNNLPKKGKPVQGKEWTIIASIILKMNTHGREDYSLQIVSLGTGSKCVGQTKMTSDGDLLNDSHAEVITKRCFTRYIYAQMEDIVSGRESDCLYFDPHIKKFNQKKNVSFIFFSSHTPCGDASIFPKENIVKDEEHLELELQPCDTPVPYSDEAAEPPAKVKKLEIPDIYRTGAKCVQGEPQDPKNPGIHHHVVGVLRTKPGRGDQTLSMSCSDKLFKWSILGVQGSLLMNFLSKPIYLSDIVIGKCPYSQVAMERAIFKRFENSPFPPNNTFYQHIPNIYQSNLQFKFSKDLASIGSLQVQPCPSSIAWCACPNKQLEVAVEGKKQGVTKKNQGKPTCRLEICKKNLFQKFFALAKSLYQDDKLCLHLKDIYSQLEKTTYNQAKTLSGDYALMWNQVRSQVVPTWTVKEKSLLEFTIQ